MTRVIDVQAHVLPRVYLDRLAGRATFPRAERDEADYYVVADPKMLSEMQLLGAWLKDIGRIKNEPDYKPSNAALTAAAMEAQHAAGLAIVQELTTRLGTGKLTVSVKRCVVVASQRSVAVTSTVNKPLLVALAMRTAGDCGLWKYQ